MYYLKSKKKDNKSKSTDDNDNKVFQQNHYNNMHKTVEQYKKQNVELQRQVEDLQQLVGERDAEVRDLAYKDLLPDQILFEHNMHDKHCKIILLNNTCDNYWALNHYKQYLEQSARRKSTASTTTSE